MRDSDWQLIESLYKTNSISKTARELYISQPALTKRLRSIEDECQSTIAIRTSTGLKFTPAGELMAKRALVYKQFMEETWDMLDSVRRKTKKELMIGAAYNYSKYTLSDLLLRYKALCPEVSISVLNESSNILFQKTVGGSLDAAFICGDYDSGLSRVLVARNQAYLMSKKPVALKELPSLQWIGYKSNDKTVELLRDWWSQTYGTDYPSGSNVGFLDFAWEIVAKSDGYTCCFLPDGFRNDYELELTPLFYPDGTPVLRNTWFVYPDGGTLPEELIRFADFIRTNVGM